MNSRPSENTLKPRRHVYYKSIGIVGALVLTLIVGNVKANILYDNLGITDAETYNSSAQNYISNAPFGGFWDVQVADDFTLTNEYDINGVTADFLSSNGASPNHGVLVEFFSDSGSAPGAVNVSVLTQSYSVTTFDNHLNGNSGMRISVDLSAMGIALGPGTWWMAVTPVDETGSGGQYFQVRQSGQPLIGQTAFVRNGGDAHGNAYGGGWPSSDWVAFGTFGNPGHPAFQPGDLAMQIQGNIVPAPSALALLAFVCAPKRRRRL